MIGARDNTSGSGKQRRQQKQNEIQTDQHKGLHELFHLWVVVVDLDQIRRMLGYQVMGSQGHNWTSAVHLRIKIRISTAIYMQVKHQK